MVVKLTGGTLTLADLRKFDDSGGSPSNMLSPTIGAEFRVTLVGGTADLRISSSSATAKGPVSTEWNSIGLTNFSAGVTEISFELVYNQLIAGRSQSPSNLGGQPWFTAFGLLGSGTGLAPDDFNVEMSVGGLFSSPSETGPFSMGLGPNSVARVSNAFNAAGVGDTTFTTIDGFEGEAQEGIGNEPNFLMIRGYDYDGIGGYTSADAPLVYGTRQTWTVTLDSGTFASDTSFVFSLDGQQYSSLANVPEPRSVVLLAGATFVLFFRRRRARSER